MFCSVCVMNSLWIRVINSPISSMFTSLTLRYHCSITVTSQWGLWPLKSLASRRCAQPFVQANIKEKNQSSVSLAFVRGIHRGPVDSPHKKASNTENVSIRWRHHANASEVTLKDMGKIDWCQTTTNHNKAWTLCIFLTTNRMLYTNVRGMFYGGVSVMCIGYWWAGAYLAASHLQPTTISMG